MGGVADFVGDVIDTGADIVSEGIDFIGDVAQEAVDVVKENPELALIAAIATGQYYMSSLTAAEAAAASATFGSSTAAEIAVAEAASAAAASGTTLTASQALAAATTANQAEYAAAFAKYGGAAETAYETSVRQKLIDTMYGQTGYVSPAAAAEGAVAVPTQGLIGKGGELAITQGTLADAITAQIPKTPTEALKTFGPTVASALASPTTGSAPISATQAAILAGMPTISDAISKGLFSSKPNVSYAGTVTQPSVMDRYNATKQQIGQTINTPSPVGLLAVNESPFYDFLKTNKIGGIL